MSNFNLNTNHGNTNHNSLTVCSIPEQLALTLSTNHSNENYHKQKIISSKHFNTSNYSGTHTYYDKKNIGVSI